MKTVIYPDKGLFPCLDLTQNNCQTVVTYLLSVPKIPYFFAKQKNIQQSDNRTIRDEKTIIINHR